MGQRHIQIVRSSGLTLAGVSDQSSESLAAARQEHGLSTEQCFSDARILLEETQPECVIVATTSPTHCAYTCLAAEKGARYILCEKPMAVSLAECDRMIEQCRAHGAKLAINHQRRFMEWYTVPKSIIASGEFGGLSSVTVVAGNLGMVMGGSHHLEMFRHLTGEEPDEVTAWLSSQEESNPRGPQFEDRAGSLRLHTPSGVRLYIEIGADQGHGMKVVYSGPRGQLVVDELAGVMYLSVRGEQHRGLPTTRFAAPRVDSVRKIRPVEDLVLEPSKAVLNALLNDGTPASGEDGRAVVALLVAAYVSDENGHIPVRPDRGLSRERVFPWP